MFSSQLCCAASAFYCCVCPEMEKAFHRFDSLLIRREIQVSRQLDTEEVKQLVCSKSKISNNDRLSCFRRCQSISVTCNGLKRVYVHVTDSRASECPHNRTCSQQTDGGSAIIPPALLSAGLGLPEVLLCCTSFA